jgi:carboxyl-terminal processing protease
MYNDIIPGAVRRDEISAKLREIDSFVRNNFLFDISDEEIVYGVYSGYISGVGDKNTVYMTVDESARHAAEKRGQLVACGIRAEKEESGYIIVTEVYPGSNAEHSGVLRNDLIVSIDGADVLQVGAEAALRLLEGEENTRYSLAVQREGEIINYSLIRQSIDIISVESEITDNNIGIARISTFNDLTASQFEAALQTFIEAGVRALMLDLRAVSSGFYDSVPDMVNQLVGANTIAFKEHRGGVRRDFIVTDDTMAFPEEMQNLPIIILVDSATSQAGELFAAVLKSHAGALVVGENTAGDPYHQQTQPLTDGSAIRVTVARIIFASGFDYTETGLVPDYVVEDGANDPQVQKAFEIIETITDLG